jgi:uncharacterized membrane protein YjjP (DUF1212 family)
MAEMTDTVIERVSPRSLVDFLMETCRVAIECGCSSDRVELLVKRLGEAWGFSVDAAALPTAVWLSVRGRGQQIIELVRLNRWSIDLNKLALLNDLVDQVEHHEMALDEAVERLRVIRAQKPPYSRALTIIAGGGSSLALVATSGGRGTELVAAFIVGTLCQLSLRFFSEGNRKYLADFFTAMLVAGGAAALSVVWADVNMPRLIIGGLISLVPGLVFVNALHEVAQKNLVSGAARLLEAIVIAISLAFGVAAVLGFAHYMQKWGT